jgi:predicted nuclease of predicted toxin-antitoxin system
MARLLADENFPQPVVVALRALGHDVLTVAEIGRANQGWPDDEVLTYATGHKRILLTVNRMHFHRLHLQQPAHTGIIACTEDLDFERLARRIHELLSSMPSVAGQFTRIYKPAR